MKETISPKEVDHVTKLANLPLTKTEMDKFSKQLSEVIEYNISLLEQIDTKNVEPTAHITGACNILREDEVEPGITQEEALKNTSQAYNKFFKVKSILDK